jgi:hypothetical protein
LGGKRQGVPQGSILGPICFLIYINDLPNLAPIDSKILLYADDTSIIVTSPKLENFETKIGKLFRDITKWFQANQLILNYNKTNYLQFTNNNSWDYNFKLHYQGHDVKSTQNTKFLGLIIDDRLSWKAHIDQMTSKLNTACFAIRTIEAIMSPESLRMVYFAYVHLIMNYGITFWGNKPYCHKIFKRAIRIITNSRPSNPCRELFKKTGNTTIILSIYFFHINICGNK